MKETKKRRREGGDGKRERGREGRGRERKVEEKSEKKTVSGTNIRKDKNILGGNRIII